MNKKLLIVDDNLNIRLLMKRIFRDFSLDNIDILFAKDGNEGWKIIKQEEPDLVFLDIAMPNMSGIEVCKMIKNDSKLKKTRVIFITAENRLYDKSVCENVGCDGYVIKPFDPVNLKELAKKILNDGVIDDVNHNHLA